MTELGKAPELEKIGDTGEFKLALETINNAIIATIKAKVPMNKPLPHTKRWWNPELNALHKRKNKLANLAYKWRGLPDHHAHDDHKRVTKEYARLIKTTKKKHWEPWLLSAAERELWTASKYATDPPMDYRRTRMPTLAHPSQADVTRTAMSNKDKSEALAGALCQRIIFMVSNFDF